ncbi:MAG TPA: ABC transporter permease, partial [Candidatus Acidoferrales bacterium]|nr:ABC transporter permease [Candidatus Acidoferrales bacterium]
MDTLWQDLRFGLRSLRRSPGFAAAAILTLALGVGANTAIFSVFHQVLLGHLPVKNSGELVVLRNPGPSNGHTWSDGDDSESFAFPMYKGLREHDSVTAGMIARYPFTASVTYRNDAEKAQGDLVSGNYFQMLGVPPALGRVFSLEDDDTPGAQPVVVLSYGYWLSRFGGDPGILNQTILVDNTALTVVGVAHPGFSGVQMGQVAQIFVPLMMKAQMTPNWNGLDDWNDRWLEVFGRLKPAMTQGQAQTGLNVIYKPLLEEQLATIKDWTAQERKEFLAKNLILAPGGQGHQSLQRDAGTPLRALMILVLLVLVLACANIANLLLARGTARYREFAIRVAMGASRWRMIRQLLAESLICAFAGGAIGLVIASWMLDALVRVLRAGAQIEGLTAQLDLSVLAFALGATMLSGIIFGLIPAWRVTQTDVSQSLKDQGSTASVAMSHVRFRKGLVATQVAFTVLLLAGAGFFARTLWNLRGVNLGLRADHLVAFTVSPQLGGYSPERTVIFSRQLRERLAALPGVSAVGS